MCRAGGWDGWDFRVFYLHFKTCVRMRSWAPIYRLFVIPPSLPYLFMWSSRSYYKTTGPTPLS